MPPPPLEGVAITRVVLGERQVLTYLEIFMNARRKWKGVKWLAAAVCGVAMVPAVHAAVVYDYVTDQSSYQAAKAGDVVNVKIYLKETLSGGSTSVIAGDGGLLGAGFSVSRLSTNLPPNPAVFITDAATGVKANLTDFGGPGGVFGANGSGSASPTDVSLSEAIAPTAPTGVVPGNTGGGVSPSIANEVYLGSVNITAGDGATSFALKIFNPGGGNTLTNNHFLDMDLGNTDSSQGPTFPGVGSKVATFTVSLVPEPTSLGFVLGIGVLGLARRRRPAMA